MNIKSLALSVLPALFMSAETLAATFDFSNINQTGEGFISSINDAGYSISLSATPFGVNPYQDSTIEVGKGYITNSNNGAWVSVLPALLMPLFVKKPVRTALMLKRSLIFTFSKMIAFKLFAFNEAPRHFGAIDPGTDIEIILTVLAATRT